MVLLCFLLEFSVYVFQWPPFSYDDSSESRVLHLYLPCLDDGHFDSWFEWILNLLFDPRDSIVWIEMKLAPVCMEEGLGEKIGHREAHPFETMASCMCCHWECFLPTTNNYSMIFVSRHHTVDYNNHCSSMTWKRFVKAVKS